MQARAGAAGQQDAFHAAFSCPLVRRIRCSQSLTGISRRANASHQARLSRYQSMVRARPARNRAALSSPAPFAAGRVDLVAKIVAGPIGDETDQPFARVRPGRGRACQDGRRSP